MPLQLPALVANFHFVELQILLLILGDHFRPGSIKFQCEREVHSHQGNK